MKSHPGLPWRALCAAVCLPSATIAATHEIAGDAVVIRYDDVTKTYALARPGEVSPFVTAGTLAGAGAGAEVESVTDPVFGSGRRIRVPGDAETAGYAALETYPGLPFALVRRTLENRSAATKDLPSFTPTAFRLALDRPASALMTLGTGGLLAADKNPGSYLFLVTADPATRRGVVAGWLSQDRASGVIFSSVAGKAPADVVALAARLDFSHLVLKPGARAELDTLAIGWFDDARLGAEAYADAVAKRYAIRLRPPAAVYCSWYAEGKNRGGAGTAATTAELSTFVARELKPYGLDVIQLDDWWQDGPQLQGPATEFSRVNPKGPYPAGIAPTAAKLRADGLTLGLWWLPFGRNHMQPEYAAKQDWFVKKRDGKPLRQKGFGGTCLDATHPEVEAHLESLARLMRGWGVTYYKMDGLSVGAGVDHVYINDGYKDDRFSDCLPRHRPEVTSIEAMRHGLATIRKGAGPDVFFSGCAASQNMRIFAGSIGLVDAMRVGPDFNHDGLGLKTGPLRASRLWFMNGRIWWNDPDPSKVRASAESSEADGSATGAVSLDQARLTTSWVSLSRQFFLISDWLPALPPERLDILRRTMGAFAGTARPVDTFDRELPNTWLASSETGGVRRDVVGVFNFEKKPLSVTYDLAKLGVDPAKTYHAFDFWANRKLADVAGEFRADVPGAACRIVALRAKVGHPVLLSTSRHVSQGMLEVASETWAADTLSGASALVAGDACELRIAGVDDGAAYAFAGVTVSPEDAAAGVRAERVGSEPGLVRVKLLSPGARTVRWSVRFTR